MLFLMPARSGVGPMVRSPMACNEGLGDWISDTAGWLKSVPGISVVANFGEKIGTWIGGTAPTVTTAANPAIKGVTAYSPVETKVAATYVNAANALNIRLPATGYAGLSAADQYRLDQQAGRYVSVGQTSFWGPLQQQIASAVGGMSTAPASPTSAPGMITSPVAPANNTFLGSITDLLKSAVPIASQYYQTKLATDLQIKTAEAQAQSQIQTEFQRQQAALKLEAERLALQQKYAPVTQPVPVQGGVVGAPYGGQFGVPMTSASTGLDVGSIFAALLMSRSGTEPASTAAATKPAEQKVPEAGTIPPILLIGGLAVGVYFLTRKGGRRR